MPTKPPEPRQGARDGSDNQKDSASTSPDSTAHDQPTRLDVAQITIHPQENVLTLTPGQTFSETIVVTIPASGMPIQNVKLVPTGAITPFVTSISPAAGFGPLSGREPHTLKFEVVFTGPPCRDEPQVLTGALEIVATLASGGQMSLAKKPVRLTVPECEPAAHYSYSVKFICGVLEDCACICTSVRPGTYATEINLYNPHAREVIVRKRLVPVVLAGTVVGREPRVADVKVEDKITLLPRTATMDDCCRIAGLLLGGKPEGALPMTIGFLEIITNLELAVSAVYTATDPKSGSLSIDVEQVRPIRIR
jgi:hypothetical protein